MRALVLKPGPPYALELINDYSAPQLLDGEVIDPLLQIVLIQPVLKSVRVRLVPSCRHEIPAICIGAMKIPMAICKGAAEISWLAGTGTPVQHQRESCRLQDSRWRIQAKLYKGTRLELRT